METMEGLTLRSFYAGKRVLVTGHTGFKGSWLCMVLHRLGAKICGYSLNPPTQPNLFSILSLGKTVEKQYVADVCDYDSLRKTFEEFDPEIVIHLAAQPIVLEGYRNPVLTYETNVMGTVNLLECVRMSSSVRSVVNVTTDKVYFNSDIPNHPFAEDEPLDGFDPYSNSKSCSELVTHSYVKSFFKDRSIAVSTARAGNVIGGGDFSPNRIIPDAVAAFSEGRPLIVRNKDSVRPYQFVLEALIAYLELAMQQWDDPSKAGAYNIGPDPVDFRSTGRLIDSFASIWGNRASWIYCPMADAPHEASFLSLNNNKAKECLGWRCTTHIDETLRLIAEWSKAWLEGEDMNRVTAKQIMEFLEGYEKCVR